MGRRRVKLNDLKDALDFVSSAMALGEEVSAYLCLEDGHIYYEGADLEEPPSEDLGRLHAFAGFGLRA